MPAPTVPYHEAEVYGTLHRNKRIQVRKLLVASSKQPSANWLKILFHLIEKSLCK